MVFKNIIIILFRLNNNFRQNVLCVVYNIIYKIYYIKHYRLFDKMVASSDKSVRDTYISPVLRL